MAVINIGPGATDRGLQVGVTLTRLDKNAPANGTGKLTKFEIWAQSQLSNVKMGTFFGSGNVWTSRDWEVIGTVTSGSKQTYLGLDCDVTLDDVPGIYGTAGNIERDAGGSSNYYNGDAFGAGQLTFTAETSIYSLYGEGSTPVGAVAFGCIV